VKWRKGQSGNPAGRPKGALGTRTKLLQKYEGRIVKRIINLALRGDRVCLRICADRLWPALRPIAAPVKVPNVKATDLGCFGRRVLRRMARGQLAPDAAQLILGALEAQARLVEHSTLVERLEALERQSQSSAALTGGIARAH
jgi:hypothetical protein